MKNLLLWVGAIALALSPACAAAQTASSVQFPAGYAPAQSVCVKQGDGTCVPVSASNALPVTSTVTVPAATSTPLTWSVSTPTTLGPWAPQTGRAIYLTKSSTDTATINVTVTTTGSCAGGVPITAANGSYTAGSFVSVSTALSELVTTEYRTGAQYCVTISTNSTSTGSLGQ